MSLLIQRIDSEDVGGISSYFCRRILTLETATPTWLDYYKLGMQLYQYSEGLWQMCGPAKMHQRQTIHMCLATDAFEAAIEAVEARYEPEDPDRAGLVDVLRSLAVVANVSLNRLHSDDQNEMAEARESVASLLGTDQLEGIVARRLEPHPGTPRLRHYAAIVNALGFKLACGPVFGFPTQFNEQSVGDTLDSALTFFNPQNREVFDQGAMYRGLLLDAALEAASRGNRAMRLFYTEKAVESARLFGSVANGDLRRAQMIRRKGAHGNRRYYRRLVRLHPLGY